MKPNITISEVKKNFPKEYERIMIPINNALLSLKKDYPNSKIETIEKDKTIEIHIDGVAEYEIEFEDIRPN